MDDINYLHSIIDKVSDELRLDKYYLNNLAKNADYYYRRYCIPKKSIGERIIEQPSAELKTMQYWVVNNIFQKLPVSHAAHAYKKGDSIKKHALVHSKARFILHVDIENFFHSINSEQLNNVLREKVYIFNDMQLDLERSLLEIRQICFRNNSLCVGAVSSPIISNIIMKPFDDSMLEYCKKEGYIYSRYADDIYVSSKHFIKKEVIDDIKNELAKSKFNLNTSKTRFSSLKHRRKITGLILTNDEKISVGTDTRLKIKKMLYDKLVYNKGNGLQIMGYLAYLKDIEPITYNNYIIKYSKYCTGDIITEILR